MIMDPNYYVDDIISILLRDLTDNWRSSEKSV